MDGSRFDALVRSFAARHSRRGLSRLFGGLALGSLPSLLPRSQAEAKRKNGKKKRKKKPGSQISVPSAAPPLRPPPVPPPPPPPAVPCPGQKLCDGVCIPANQCCADAECPAGSLCCGGVCTGAKLATGGLCEGDHLFCCSDYCRFSTVSNGQLVWTCAATCRGKICAQDSDCCRGQPCLNVDSTTGFGRCGGCGRNGDPCESEADCCFSACTARPGESQKWCLSYAGQPCETNFDCRSCRFGAECKVGLLEICHAGICGCPDECCADAGCPGPQFRICDVDGDGLNGMCKDPSTP